MWVGSALLLRTVCTKGVSAASSDWWVLVALLCVYALYGHKQLVPTEASCHRPEPGLAAAPQRRHTMLVGSCLGDYNQATRETALQHRWISQLSGERTGKLWWKNGLCGVNTWWTFSMSSLCVYLSAEWKLLKHVCQRNPPIQPLKILISTKDGNQWWHCCKVIN